MEDPNENYRVRNVVMYYYLDYHTFHIVEPRKENSGIPQGVFLKRHQLPKAEGEGTVQWEDLKVGSNLNVYGRVFGIYDCDAFTKEFFNNAGRAVGTPETLPEDPFSLPSANRLPCSAPQPSTAVSRNSTSHARRRRSCSHATC